MARRLAPRSPSSPFRTAAASSTCGSASRLSWSPATILDNGQIVGYWQLAGFFDGYINVHMSRDDLSVVATGDIGVLGF